jgi:hypothetical protein
MMFAMGEWWHPHHLICAGSCGRALVGGSFHVLSKDDKQVLLNMAHISSSVTAACHDEKVKVIYHDPTSNNEYMFVS